jgi:hypothetical protein
MILRLKGANCMNGQDARWPHRQDACATRPRAKASGSLISVAFGKYPTLRSRVLFGVHGGLPSSK